MGINSEDGAGLGTALTLRLAGDESAFQSLPDADRIAANTLLPYFLALQEHEPSAHMPALEDDPIAIVLGLVPGPNDVLSPARIRTARQRAKLTVAELAARLRARQWEDVATRTIFAWERTPPTKLPPALLNAIADELKTNADEIREPRVNLPAETSAGLDDEAVVTELAAWARQTGRSLAAVEAELRETISRAAARNRPEAIDQVLLLKVIEILRLADRQRAEPDDH